jgi:hypothetical protein
MVAILTSSAFAAEKASSGVTPNLNKGTKVLEGSGYIDVMADEIQIQLTYGKFVTDGVEVALLAGLRDNDSYMSTELGVRAEYNFIRDAALVPFVGAGVVWADVEADDVGVNIDAAILSVGGGAKYFMRDNVALAMSGNYLFATDDIFVDSEENELEDDEVRFLFSVRFYFD